MTSADQMNGRQPPHPTLVQTVSPLHGIPTTYHLTKGTKRTDFCGRCGCNLYACPCPLERRPWLRSSTSSHVPHSGPYRAHQTQEYSSTGPRSHFFTVLVVSFFGAAATGSVGAVFVGWPLFVLLWALYTVVTSRQPTPPPGGWYTPPHWNGS